MSLYGDVTVSGIIRGFHKELQHLAMVELDSKTKLMLGNTMGRYRLSYLRTLIPLDY
jgi:hypothetical protein